jgi:hypothetical protein
VRRVPLAGDAVLSPVVLCCGRDDRDGARGAQPWRCLWRRFSQITMTRPWRRITLHLSQILLTLGWTFTSSILVS